MPQLPCISGRKAVRVSVPDQKEVANGTLRSLIRSAGLTVDDFVNAMA